MMASISPIYNPSKGKMRIAGLMSGSGRSLETVILQQIDLEKKGGCPYEVVVIFSDNPKSRARELGAQYEIPVIIRDIREFYASKNAVITDKRVREMYDLETVRALKDYSPDVVLYTGYVWITTAPLVNAFIGVNGHPADLSIVRDGRRAYAGAHGVRDALLAGEEFLSSTVHLVTTEVDGGPILMISKRIPVVRDSRTLQELERYYLEILNGELRKLFPKVSLALALGHFQIDESGLVYYQGRPVPNGVRLED